MFRKHFVLLELKFRTKGQGLGNEYDAKGVNNAVLQDLETDYRGGGVVVPGGDTDVRYAGSRIHGPRDFGDAGSRGEDLTTVWIRGDSLSKT